MFPSGFFLVALAPHMLRVGKLGHSPAGKPDWANHDVSDFVYTNQLALCFVTDSLEFFVGRPLSMR